MTRLVTERLRSGTLIVRPEGTLGTCGFSPKAWNLAIVRRGGSYIEAFLEANKNWKREELEAA